MTDRENEIWELIQKKERAESREKALRLIASGLAFFALAIFVASPLIQVFVRLIEQAGSEAWVYGSSNDSTHNVKMYYGMIQYINVAVHFIAAVLYIYCIYTFIRDRKKLKEDILGNLGRIVPWMMFMLFALGIVLVTAIRGANEYDLTGHPYMHESIYSYILYAFAYFFCGMFLISQRAKRVLLYVMVFSAFPVNVLALVNNWFTPIKFFVGGGKTVAVFHNSNHYGYYLAVTIIVSALLLVYEKNLFLRIFSGVSAVTALVSLIINNSLGPYLAVLAALICFLIFCLVWEKKKRLFAVLLLVGFAVITGLMSIKYDTVVSSLGTLGGDIGKIVSDPLADETAKAGSSRWRLWVNTVKNIPEHPILGFGVEGMLNTHGVGTPHNEVLQYAENFGIPVTLLYIASCLLVLWRVFKRKLTVSRTALICFFAAICYLVSSLVGVAIYYTTPFVFILLGLAYSECLRPVPPETEKTPPEEPSAEASSL
ncbi:MAG: O-antigen ligase family protein [Ruminococcus sp.]|nr:O-antigen ligase family protein [Ruminococcus sp.]